MDFRETERVETSDVATVELAKNDAPAASESASDVQPTAKLNDSGEAKVHARRFDVVTDRDRDALLTDFGKDTLQRPLSAARRILSGSVRARRRRPMPTTPAHAQRALRLYLEAVVHAGDAGPVERRHRPRPADQLLSEQRRRQPRGHRRHLERECLARRARRRHRHLLGQRPRHRRAGRPQRQDQRHHPVRPRDGQPDARDHARARCAAARPPAISTSRTRRSRSSSRSASPRATSTARR